MNRFSPLHGMLMVVCLVVGVVIGGLGPRSDARALREQLAKSKECKTSGVGADIANVFRGRPWDDAPHTSPKKKPIAVATTSDGLNTKEDDGGLNIKFNIGEDAPEDANTAEQLDLARDALELRYKQAMEALKQDADPTETQLAEIDQVIDKMNDDLIRLANDLAGELESEEPSRHNSMLYAAETLDVLLEAEEQLGSVLTTEQQNALQDESLDPLSYVDPALIDTLAKIDE